MNNKMYHFIA